MIKSMCFICMVCLSTAIFAQKTAATMQLEPENAAINEPIKVTFTINASTDKLILPDLSDFRIIFEPNSPVVLTTQTGTPGDMGTMVETTYTYLICGKKAGKYKIGNASFTVKGKHIKTNSAKIKIEDRTISAADSAKISEKYTGFIVNTGTYKGNKTAIDYSKSNTKNTTPTEESVGTGVDRFEITTEKTSLHVKADEEFTLVYNIYREASRQDFDGEVEVDAAKEIAGFDITEGPSKSYKSKGNSKRMVMQGTVTYTMKANAAGTYTIPSIKIKSGTTVAISPIIDVVAE